MWLSAVEVEAMSSQFAPLSVVYCHFFSASPPPDATEEDSLSLPLPVPAAAAGLAGFAGVVTNVSSAVR